MSGDLCTVTNSQNHCHEPCSCDTLAKPVGAASSDVAYAARLHSRTLAVRLAFTLRSAAENERQRSLHKASLCDGGLLVRVL